MAPLHLDTNFGDTFLPNYCRTTGALATVQRMVSRVAKYLGGNARGQKVETRAWSCSRRGGGMIARGARGDRGRQIISVIPPFLSLWPGGAQPASTRHNTWCACTTMLAQREVDQACLSQDRLGRGVDAHTAAATLDKGFPLVLYWVASRGGPTRRWVSVSRYVACSCGPS